MGGGKSSGVEIPFGLGGMRGWRGRLHVMYLRTRTGRERRKKVGAGNWKGEELGLDLWAGKDGKSGSQILVLVVNDKVDQVSCIAFPVKSTQQKKRHSHLVFQTRAPPADSACHHLPAPPYRLTLWRSACEGGGIGYWQQLSSFRSE